MTTSVSATSIRAAENLDFHTEAWYGGEGNTSAH